VRISKDLPLCALSLLSIIGCLVEFPPSSLTASPRLLVNTFKHTLRGGILLNPSLLIVVDGGAKMQDKNLKGMKVFLGKMCNASFWSGKVS
jgi:hypothetical protein